MTSRRRQSKGLSRTSEDLPKHEEVAKLSKPEIEMSNNFVLVVDEDGTEEPQVVVPEGLMNEELLELE